MQPLLGSVVTQGGMGVYIYAVYMQYNVVNKFASEALSLAILW